MSRFDLRFHRAWILVAVVLFSLGNGLTSATEVNFVNLAFLRLAFSSAGDCGDYDAVRRDLRESITRLGASGRPGLPGLKFVLSYLIPGERLRKAGRVHEALACYQAGIAPTREVLAFRERAETLSAGSYTRSLRYYQALLHLHSGTILLYELNRPDQAREQLESGLETKPGVSELYTALAHAYLWTGKTGEAAEAVEESLRIAETPLALSIKGGIKGRQGDHATAIRSLERAWSMDRSRVADLYDAALLRRRAGDCAGARKNLQIVLSSGTSLPVDRDRLEALARETCP